MTLVEKSSSRKHVIWIVLLITAISAGVGYRSWVQSKSSRITYKEVSIARGRLDVSILSTGVVQPDNRLEIKPPIAGRVERILVNEGDKVKKGQVLAWMSSTERAALLDAATARGPEELKQWEEMYRSTPILAPINGSIIQRNVESGQTFTIQDAVLVMSDRLTVKAQVDETDISQIKLKQRAKIVLDAYAQNVIAAHVDQIAFDAKTVNNVTTYVVDVLPLHTPQQMRSGMTANVTFEIASRENALIAPVDAIKIESGKSYILVKSTSSSEESTDQFTKREVQTGLTDGKKIEIISGVSEKDVILVPEIQFGRKKSDSGTSPFSPMGRPARR